jgi:hypothetical protein
VDFMQAAAAQRAFGELLNCSPRTARQASHRSAVCSLNRRVVRLGKMV